MSWFGRQMRTYSKNGISANFMYDADGLRSSKTVNGVKTTYQYVGDQLFYEKIGENKTLYYFYDSYGNLSQIYYTFGTGEDASTARYFVSTNAQGDVIGLYNYNGVKVGAYDYDAWGNTRMFVVTQDADGNNVHTQINPETQYLNHIVNVNPIRYRGYYYDADLDLYYLQSRYYDSEIGRFINSDNVSDSDSGVLGYNTYIYASNNPIKNSDPNGHSIIMSIVLGAVFGAVGSAICEVARQYRITNGFTTGKIDGRAVARSALIGGVCGGVSGGISGALSAYGVSQGVQAGVDILVSGCSSVVETCWQSNCDVTASECAYSFISGVASGCISTAFSFGVQSYNAKTFQSLSNGTKKELLNINSYDKTYTTAMVRDGVYKKDPAYFECISVGTNFTSNATSTGTTIAIDLFISSEG